MDFVVHPSTNSNVTSVSSVCDTCTLAAWLSSVLLKEGICYKDSGKEWPIVDFLSAFHSSQKKINSVTFWAAKNSMDFPHSQGSVPTALWHCSRGATHGLVHVSSTLPSCTNLCSLSDKKSSLSDKYISSYDYIPTS